MFCEMKLLFYCSRQIRNKGYKHSYNVCTVHLIPVALSLGINVSQSAFHRVLGKKSANFFYKGQIANI